MSKNKSASNELTEKIGSSIQAAQRVNDAIVDEILSHSQDPPHVSKSDSASNSNDTYDSNNANTEQQTSDNELTEEDRKEDSEMVLDPSESKTNTVVSLMVSVVSVEPVSVHIEVNVSHPTTVWCEGVLRGKQIVPSSIRNSREGTLVSGFI